MATWTTPDDVRAKVMRRWADGSLLRGYAVGDPFAPIEVPLRGPKASDIGDDLGAAQQWVSRLDAGRRNDTRYTLEWTSIGGRHFGRNQFPSRAIVSSYEQAWGLIGVEAATRRFTMIVELVAPYESATAWVLANPHKALELGEEWPALLAAYTWLDTHRASGAYLRQISAPGVDTKFAEQHRAVLAAMLGVPHTAAGFITALGLRPKPELMRMRFSPGHGLPAHLTEVAVRSQEMASLSISVGTAVVCENEITYLSVPVPRDGVVIWGKGFEVDRVGRLPWLSDADVYYWGDIDTHGFAILNRLRAWLPKAEAILMDRETLMTHRPRWVVETTPTRAHLGRLGSEEAALYEDLVTDRLGDRVRLEQELIDWSWAEERFPF